MFKGYPENGLIIKPIKLKYKLQSSVTNFECALSN